ncbi:hypothetical protein JHD48_06560 [Sulfurimonas sp. SAG-AH-194-I05]|nr:hypothetical protein [Sulfurimonas sp. SAG-AH-194-I05]MDF1875390.1 hypothetical protein [Sulfurimonas sp. SAG-AH-194-I05]
MKKVLYFVLLVSVFIATFIIVFPKEKLYFLLQEELTTHNIHIESQTITSNAFSLDIKNTNIFLAGSKIASVKNLHVTLLGFDASHIRSLGTFKNMLPPIDTVETSLSLEELATAKGNFGTLRVAVNLESNKLVVTANINSVIKNKYNMLFAQFKKQGSTYVYELHF